MHLFGKIVDSFVITIGICFCQIGSVKAQQEPQFSQNMFNILPFNPGNAGMNDAICITGLFREQWMGFKATVGDKSEKVNPTTTALNACMPLRVLHGGIGVSILTDKLGFENNTIFRLAYSYHTDIGFGTLGVGLHANLHNKALDFTKFEPFDKLENDSEEGLSSDPVLSSKQEEKNMAFDLGFGGFYKIDNQLYVGLSGTQLLQSKISLGSSSPQLRRHLFLTGGYYFQFPNQPKLELNPSIFVKSDMASLQMDMNALFRYDNKLWAGLSYRHQDAVALLFGLTWTDYKFGFSYDVTTSALGYKKKASYGSIEVMVNYCFKVEPEKLPQHYKNVRFL